MSIMWDPKTYPDVDSIESLGKALEKDGGVVRYFNGAAYMTYLQQSGILPKKVLDGSYDGTPAKFVSAGGKDAQQGFATAEPYIYQNQSQPGQEGRLRARLEHRVEPLPRGDVDPDR